MTTPTGTISFQDVANEFGLGRPIAMSGFRGLGGAPSTSAISLGDMRGRSAATVYSLAPGTYTYTGKSSLVLTASKAVQWTWSASGNTQYAAGSGPASGTTSTQLTLNAPVAATSGTSMRSVTYTVSAEGLSWSITLRTEAQGA